MAESKTPKPFDAFLKSKAKEYLEMSKLGEIRRAQVAVTFSRRFRGTTYSDRFGIFSPNGTGQWLGDSPGEMAFANMKSLNIVQLRVIAATAALVTAKIQLKIEAANKDPELGGVANIANGLFRLWDGRDGDWDERLQAQISELGQMDYGWFIRSRPDDHKRVDSKYESAQFEMSEMPTAGKFACSCGAGGPFFPKEGEQVGETIECPMCRQQAHVLEAPGTAPMEVPSGSETKSYGDNSTEVITALEVRLDERRSQGGRLDRCNWFDYHPLETETELQAQYPGFKLGSPVEWSYPIRWKRALETGTEMWLRLNKSEDRKEFEVRNIWMRPSEYLNYVCPADYELKDGQGETVFSIEAGTKLVDEFPEGFCFKITGDLILPEIYPQDFREEWVYGGFTPDPRSFWCQPRTPLLEVQDDINTLYTIDFQHRERNSQTSIAFNEIMFDEDSFENDLIPTKSGVEQVNPLDYYIKEIPAPQMGTALQGMQYLFGLLPNVEGTQPAALGAPSPGEPYAAQLLQKQSSLGLLAPAGQSMAFAKMGWFKQQCKIAQATWPDERFEYLRTRLGEEWLPEDIKAFRNANLDRDLEVDYVEGSEIPISMVEREVKLDNVIMKLGQIPPEIMQTLPKELVSQYLQTAGIDYDISNIEAEERLCMARLKTIESGMLATKDDQPEMAIQKILSHPQLQVLPVEDSEAAIEFYSDRMVAAMAREMPDQLYITILHEMITRHQNAETEKKQGQVASDVEAQKPMLEAQSQMEQAKGQQESEATMAQIQAQGEQVAAKLASEERQNQADNEMEAARLAMEQKKSETDLQASENEDQREMERMVMENQLDRQKADQELQQKREEHAVNIQHQKEMGKVKIQVAKAAARAKPKPAKASK